MSWEAWGDPEDPPELPDGWLDEEEAEDLRRNVGDLAMLVKKLVRSIRNGVPEQQLADRAMDYLQREGLCESPLRETSNAELRPTGAGLSRQVEP